jgi:F-type H+-transporting ATPase subunit b
LVELQPLDILIHIINIVVLFILLRLILFKPVTRFLDERAERIRNQLSEAENALKEAQSLKLEYQRQLDTAAEQGHDVIRASQTKATQEAQAIIANANAQAEKILSEAQERIAKEKERAVEQMRQEVAQLATEIAARILKREVTTADNVALAEEFFREMRKK